MPISLPDLPFNQNALEPHVSQKTMTFHYDRHHRGYVDKLNKLIKDTAYDDLTLEEIIVRARKQGDIAVLNNAAQAWNHTFFWNSMSPNGGRPGGVIKQKIEASFNDVDEFKKQFRSAALSQFGSGWVWLLIERGNIRIASTGNAETPAGTDLIPILTLDVWEHAYYLDYQNERARFVDAFLDNLINWDFAAANLEAAQSGKAA